MRAYQDFFAIDESGQRTDNLAVERKVHEVVLLFQALPTGKQRQPAPKKRALTSALIEKGSSKSPLNPVSIVAL
jgi:hypothetical protein